MFTAGVGGGLLGGMLLADALDGDDYGECQPTFSCCDLRTVPVLPIGGFDDGGDFGGGDFGDF